VSSALQPHWRHGPGCACTCVRSARCRTNMYIVTYIIHRIRTSGPRKVKVSCLILFDESRVTRRVDGMRVMRRAAMHTTHSRLVGRGPAAGRSHAHATKIRITVYIAAYTRQIVVRASDRRFCVLTICRCRIILCIVCVG